MNRQRDRQTDRQTDNRQTDRQTDRRTDRQTDANSLTDQPVQCGTASPQQLLGDDMFPQAAHCTEERRAERGGGRRRQRETGRMTPLPAGV